MALSESHMRIVYSIPSHRESLRSSEPILAEAAAQYMDSTQFFNVPDVLARYALYEFIKKGESGELAARLLLMTAYDNAVKNKLPGAKFPFYSDPVPLFSFLGELFGEDNCNTLFKSTCRTPVHYKYMNP